MRRHPFDPLSFVFGVLFLVLGLSFALSEPGIHAARPVRLWPVAGIVVGVTIAVWAISRARRRAAPAAEAEPASQPDVAPEEAQAEGPRP